MKKPKKLDYDRDLDGTVYIAINGRARTVLGRMLSAGAHLPMEHKTFGSFKSLAGFLRCLRKDRRDWSHMLSGLEFDAEISEKFPAVYEDVAQQHVIDIVLSPRGVELKLLTLLRSNVLPFAIYEDADGVLMPVDTPPWFAEVLDKLTNQKGN